MSAKRKCEGDSIIKKRNWLTLEQKLDIIRLHEEGASFAKIGREKGMVESSVRKLIKKKDQYKSQGMATASYLSKVVTKTRSTRMVKMERLLSIWINDLNQKRVPLSQMEIRAKAVSLYNDLKTIDNVENQGGGSNENFTASRGWFFRFKQRTGIHNVRVGESAGADKPWHELSSSNMRAEWKHIPQCANDFIETHFAEVTNNLVDIGQKLGFKELDSNVNVNVDCTESNTIELDNETLIKIYEQRAYQEQEDNDDCVEVPVRELTAEQLSKIIGMVGTLSDHIMEVDPNNERSIAIRETLNNAIHGYKEVYSNIRPKDKYVQTSILQFLNKK